MADIGMHTELSKYEITDVEGLENATERGRGSFGAVYEVEAYGVPCIAKCLHSILVSYQAQHQGSMKLDEKGVDVIRSKFCDECVLHSQLRHPNVVQFLGVHYGMYSGELALIVEKLEWDLGKFVETYKQIPDAIKISLLLDVVYGLQYLHSRKPRIIHRDLSAGNVLISREGRAKIADLGASKILTVNAFQAHTAGQPGAFAYMPPEALQANPEYDQSLDVFSFGAVALYTATHKFPYVHEMRSVADLQESDGQIQIAKRRAAMKMAENSCLLPLIKHCLSDKPADRPTTSQLCKDFKNLALLSPLVPGEFVWLTNNEALSQDNVTFVRKENERLKAEVRRAAELNETQRRHVKLLVADVQQREADNGQLNQRLATSQHNYQLELATLRGKVKTYQEEFDNAKNEVDRLNEQTTRQEEEIQQLTADNDDLTRQFQEAVKDNAEHKDPELSRKASEYDTLLERYRNLENELQPLRQERTTILRENAQLREGSDPQKYTKLQQNYDGLAEHCQQLEAIVADHEDTNREMQTKLDQMTNPEMLQSNILERMERYRAERDSSRKKAEKLDRLLAVADAEKEKKLQEATEQLAAEIEDYREQTKKLLQDIAHKDVEIGRLMESLCSRGPQGSNPSNITAALITKMGRAHQLSTAAVGHSHTPSERSGQSSAGFNVGALQQSGAELPTDVLELQHQLEAVKKERDSLVQNQQRVNARWDGRVKRLETELETLRAGGAPSSQATDQPYSKVHSLSGDNPTHCPLCRAPVTGRDGLELHYLTSCKNYDKLSDEQPRSKPRKDPAPSASSHSNTGHSSQGGVARRDTSTSGSSKVQFMWQPLTDITYPTIMLLTSFEPGSITLKLNADDGYYESAKVSVPNGTFEGQLAIGEDFVYPVKKFTVNKPDDIIVLQFDVEQGKELSGGDDLGMSSSGHYGSGLMHQNPSYGGGEVGRSTRSSAISSDLGGGSGGYSYYKEAYQNTSNRTRSSVQPPVTRHTPSYPPVSNKNVSVRPPISKNPRTTTVTTPVPHNTTSSPSTTRAPDNTPRSHFVPTTPDNIVTRSQPTVTASVSSARANTQPSNITAAPTATGARVGGVPQSSAAGHSHTPSERSGQSSAGLETLTAGGAPSSQATDQPYSKLHSLCGDNPTHCPLCRAPVTGSDGLCLHYLTSCKNYDKLSDEQPRSKPRKDPAPSASSHSNTGHSSQGGVARRDTSTGGSSKVQFMWQPLTDITYPTIMLLTSFEPGSITLKLNADDGYYESAKVSVPNGTYEGQLAIGEDFVYPVKKFTVNKPDDIIVLQFDIEQGKELSGGDDLGMSSSGRYGSGLMHQNPSYGGGEVGRSTRSSAISSDLGGGSGGYSYYKEAYQNTSNRMRSSVQPPVTRHTPSYPPVSNENVSVRPPISKNPRTTTVTTPVPHSTTSSSSTTRAPDNTPRSHFVPMTPDNIVTRPQPTVTASVSSARANTQPSNITAAPTATGARVGGVPQSSAAGHSHMPSERSGQSSAI